MSLRIHITY